jgi:uncharacterized protein (TIGR03089 family)
MTTLGARFAAAVAVDPTRPLLTWYDDRKDERTELSGATLANWVAKTANLLVSGAGLDAGDRATVLLPPHWQTAAVLLGCWSAGLEVSTGPALAEVGFATAERAAELTQPERYLVGLHPLGLPLPEVPEGYADYSAQARGYGDRFAPPVPVDPDGPAAFGYSHTELIEAAARRAEKLEIEPGDRVLIDADRYPDPLNWLLAPLSVDASIVLCGQLDPDRVWERVGAERVTRNLAG